MPKFIQAHRDQPFLLPPDMRQWAPDDDLSHFVLEAVERVPMELAAREQRPPNRRGAKPKQQVSLVDKDSGLMKKNSLMAA